MHTITPRLVVPSVAKAVEFYTQVFAARERERYSLSNGHVVHAAIVIGNALVTLADEARQWRMLAPASIGGSPVLLTIELDDPDAVCARAVANGAEVLIPLADQFYGRREGRIRDPFGHLWILSKPVEEVSRAEIERRMAVWES